MSTSPGDTLPSTHFQEVEFWRVSPEEVQVNQHEILGGGAWGYVAKGKFRGQIVAVKCVYPSILQPTTVNRIHREISTMAQVHHPNLVLFIAAVLDDRTGPMIITEILDTNLCTAYEENRLGSSQVRIFQEIASALNYLRLHREPIISQRCQHSECTASSSCQQHVEGQAIRFWFSSICYHSQRRSHHLHCSRSLSPASTSPTLPPPQTPKIELWGTAQ